MNNEKTLKEFVSPANQALIRNELLDVMKEYGEVQTASLDMKISYATLKKFFKDGMDVEWSTLAKIERFLINRAKKDKQ